MAPEPDAAREPHPAAGSLAPAADTTAAQATETRTGLLIDWGGVLTTNLFASFHAFCVESEIEPETVLGRFRTDPAARELLIALETGGVREEDFDGPVGRAL